MLGTVRFFLALCVMVSHLPNDGMKLNLGVIAVVCFYFISGFLMQKSFSRFQQNCDKPISSFYLDRCIKLFPQYLIIVFATFFVVWFFGESKSFQLLNQQPEPIRIFLNALLLPVNYVFPPLQIDSLMPHPIIPPAWSLSSEFHFYLLLPFIFVFKKRWWALLLFVAMAIQFSSLFFTTKWFNSNVFGYRLIFGVLTIFLYGFAFAKYNETFYKKATLFIWFVYVLMLFIVTPAFDAWSNKMVQEILLGGFLALPLGFFFVNTHLKGEFDKKIDEKLGNLAYPIFISHFFVFYVVENILHIPTSSRSLFYFTAILLCIVMSFFMDVIQQRIERFRIKQRGFSSIKNQASE